MRYIPSTKYSGIPCSYIATGCAYEDLYHKPFTEPMPTGLKKDGWATLENTNKYIRRILSVKKKVYFKQNERIVLKKFLADNTENCILCVRGHFLYANKKDYWSFFNNDFDEVVCIWYLSQ